MIVNIIEILAIRTAIGVSKNTMKGL